MANFDPRYARGGVATANGTSLQPNILGWVAFFSPLALTSRR